MVVLKRCKYRLGSRLKASTLVETLTATVILLLVFGIAMGILLNVFQQSVQQNQGAVQNRLYTLGYQWEHGKVTLPYEEDFENWHILLSKTVHDTEIFILLQATHKKTKRQLQKKLIYEQP